MPLTYSIALLLLYVILLVGEFFIPSAGTVGVAAAISALASIAIAFTHSLTAGIVITLFVVIITPLILYLMIQHWPSTAIGRRILNRQPGQLDEPTESRLRSGAKRKELLGRVGIAQTHLMPSGLVVIDGMRLDAVSEGSVIDAGTQVVVISLVAGKIHVRAAGESDIMPEQFQIQRQVESIESSLETMDLDGLEE
ncbi:NfeD family protein [Stieleria sp. TO1_6]|uniref:NfeD family protein n=1 Tax=Stieleria tagensis TaxID=2956795 RepID=UPI00209B9FA8|nr:NfeD family protein [Stieleria tagensis]MCO8123030.1 NfeD family protein [Stieleria tagensis]